ncbi:MAG: hypothetical protein J5980_03375 [Muribaculaceae bacterium]|nr:hypothetical protein [Muribaculaceae bacterium]MBO6250851.1 hypothetical protein [Muribaculaceae bacterium]
MNTEYLNRLFFSVIGAVTTALSPTLPYILLCTVAVLADCYTAWRLGKRVKAAHPDKTTSNTGKFNSRHFRSVLVTLAEVYALLVFAHFTHIYITGELPFNALKLAAGLVIGWQVWSCLENLSSCNGAKWAKMLQNVMIDKTERHFDVNLNDLKESDDDND